MSITPLVASIQSYFHLPRRTISPFLIAIDGLGGAGKTTLAKELELELQTVNNEVFLLHLDDFIVESSKRYGTGDESWKEYYFHQWDVESLRAGLFERLRGNKEVILPLYNQNTDSVSLQTIKVPSSAIVLIEGVFAQREEWRPFYDFSIFLDCLREERVARVLQRDSYLGGYEARVEKYEKRYWPAEEFYVRTQDPLGEADVVYRTKG